jgi:hypothetical protein
MVFLNAHVHVQEHPPTSFFPFFHRAVFLIAFSGVSQQAEFKNTKEAFLIFFHVENILQNK